MKKTLMYKLNSKFQRELFERVIEKFGDSTQAGKILRIPASSVRGYKNLYFDSIPFILLKNLIEIEITTLSETERNTLQKLFKEDVIKKSMDKGRLKIKNKFSKLRAEIPSVKGLIQNNSLNVLAWFEKYKPLLDSGFRKSEVEFREDYFVVKYPNFNRTEIKNFSVKLPKSFRLDEEFFYFFGLWCGDRVGGKRFGICNKNEAILNFTENFLKKNYQTVEKILFITRGIAEPDRDYDKRFILDHDKNGWVLTCHSNNGILSSFFYYLQKNLGEMLIFIKNKEPFFAGLFDAEGNVSLYNKSFRWACKNERLIKIYSAFLKKMKLFDKYDGNCLITYNKKDFYSRIFPYLKHPDKKDLTKFMITGSPLPFDYITILKIINLKPQMAAKDIAKALKKNKLYSELRLLNDFGFIFAEGYPLRFEITPKGLKELGKK